MTALVDGSSIRLCLMVEAPDANGLPRAALIVPPSPTRYGVHSTTILFPSLGAAIAAKRMLEEGSNARA